MRTTLVVALTVALWTSVSAAELPAPKPTARDMYVACYLLAHDSDVPKRASGQAEQFSSSYCAAASLSMIANREGKENTSKYRFCLDRGAATSANIPKAMAFAYLDYFEGPALRDKGVDGMPAYLFAMMERWPCPA